MGYYGDSLSRTGSQYSSRYLPYLKTLLTLCNLMWDDKKENIHFCLIIVYIIIELRVRMDRYENFGRLRY